MNINIVRSIVQLVDVFASLPYFTLPVEIVIVLVLFLFHWSLPVPMILYALLEVLTLCCFN